MSDFYTIIGLFLLIAIKVNLKRVYTAGGGKDSYGHQPYLYRMGREYQGRRDECKCYPKPMVFTNKANFIRFGKEPR